MKKLFVATMIATLFAASTAFALDSWQTTEGYKATEGTVQSVDPAGQTLTLVNGMTLMIPSNISTEPLTQGEEVTVAYKDGQDGQKEMIAFWIGAGAGGDSHNN
jgi:hypothetical protein